MHTYTRTNHDSEKEGEQRGIYIYIYIYRRYTYCDTTVSLMRVVYIVRNTITLFKHHILSIVHNTNIITITIDTKDGVQ